LGKNIVRKEPAYRNMKKIIKTKDFFKGAFWENAADISDGSFQKKLWKRTKALFSQGPKIEEQPGGFDCRVYVETLMEGTMGHCDISVTLGPVGWPVIELYDDYEWVLEEAAGRIEHMLKWVATWYETHPADRIGPNPLV